MPEEEVEVDELPYLLRARARYGKLRQCEAHYILEEFDVVLSQSFPNFLPLVGASPIISLAFFARL